MDQRERNKNICDAYLEGDSAGSIASKWGLSEIMVRKIIAAAGIRQEHRKGNGRGRKAYERGPLSEMHRKLGVRVCHQRELEMNLTVTELAHLANMSPHKLVQIERGTHDPTVSELTRLSEASGLPVSELIN